MLAYGWIPKEASEVSLLPPDDCEAACERRLGLRVVATTLEPFNIPPKFLRQHAHRGINWALVIDTKTEPLSESSGLSEATLLRLKLESHDSDTTTPLTGSALGSPLAKIIEKGKKLFSSVTNRENTSAPVVRRCASLEVLLPSTPKAQIFKPKIPRYGSLQHCTLAEQAAATQQQVPHTPEAPPCELLLKHYDTSNVETPSLALRLARHLMHTTAENMAKHEIFFYATIRPLLDLHYHRMEAASAVPPTHPNLDKFRSPKLLFAAHDDRGEPGCLKYVCCHKGTGSATTLGLENMERRGYSFAHVRTHGFSLRSPAPAACLRSVAVLHREFWGLTKDYRLQQVDCAPIPRFIHRCGQAMVERMNHNMDLHSVSLDAIYRTWGEHEPALLNKWAQLAIADIHANWRSIRQESVRIVLGSQTIVHGDLHYRNIGLRESDVHATPIKYRRRREYNSAEDADESKGSRGGNYGTLECSLSSSQAHDDVSATANNTPQEATHVAAEPMEGQKIVPCFVDFQSCGPGSAAAEVLYFLCTSLPIPPSGARLDDAGGLNADQPATAATEVDCVASASAGASTTETRTRSASATAATSHPSNVRSRSFSTQKGPLPRVTEPAATPRLWYSDGDLAAMRSMDEFLLRTYYTALGANVQRQYSWEAFAGEVMTLAQHWAGCVLMDMSSSNPTIRANFAKRSKEFGKLICWSERTALRAILLCASLRMEGPMSTS